MKPVFSILLTLALMLGLFGCSSGEAVPTEATAESTAATVPVEVTVPPTEAEPPVTEPVYDLNTWQGNYDQGLSYVQDHQWENAITAFEAAIALDPQKADAYAQRGNVRIRMEESEDTLKLAWEDYQKALSLDGANALAYRGVVDIHIRRGEYDQADAAMADAAAKTNNDPLLDFVRNNIENGIYMDSSYQYRRTVQTLYNSENKYIGSVIVEYEDGIAVTAESFNASGKSTGFVELSTVTDGNVTTTVFYGISIGHEDVSVSKRIDTETIHEDGTSEKVSVSYNRDGKPGSTGHTYYDAAGNEVRHESYGSDGALQFYSTRELDSQGRVIRINNYNSDDTLREYTLHFYDSEGKQIRTEFYVGDNMRDYTLHMYTEDGYLKARETYSPDGELLHKVVFE